jgi:hypothetical protein
MFIQYTRCFPPKLEVVSSSRNLRTPHAVVTRDPPNMESFFIDKNSNHFSIFVAPIVWISLVVLQPSLFIYCGYYTGGYEDSSYLLRCNAV